MSDGPTHAPLPDVVAGWRSAIEDLSEHTSPCRYLAPTKWAATGRGATHQTVTIAAESTDEAAELAQLYRAGLPSEAIISAPVADADGAVFWSDEGGDAPGTMPLKKDQR